MRQTKQQTAQAKQRGAGDKNTFSVDGIRRQPCGQQKAAECQHKAIGQPRQRSGRAAQRLLYRGVVMTPPVKLNGSSKAAIKTESAAWRWRIGKVFWR